MTKDKKTRNALKAKLRKLCERKKNQKLQVPEWLHEQWKEGNHMAMALNLQKANFNKDNTPLHCQTKHPLINVPIIATGFFQVHPASIQLPILPGGIHQAVRADDHRAGASEEYRLVWLVLERRHEDPVEMEGDSWISMLVCHWFAKIPSLMSLGFNACIASNHFSINHSFILKCCLRKKIDGAVKVCMQDELNLVRLGVLYLITVLQ